MNQIDIPYQIIFMKNQNNNLILNNINSKRTIMNLQITIPQRWLKDDFTTWIYKIEQKLKKRKLGR